MKDRHAVIELKIRLRRLSLAYLLKNMVRYVTHLTELDLDKLFERTLRNNLQARGRYEGPAFLRKVRMEGSRRLGR